MFDANKELMLYASDDVLTLYNDWLNKSRAGVMDLEQFSDLIVAIRRDMGNARTSITRDDVLRQMITDYEAMRTKGDLVVRRQPLS